MISRPFSLDSSFEIHICWKEPSELYTSLLSPAPTMIDPPVQALNGL